MRPRGIPLLGVGLSSTAGADDGPDPQSPAYSGLNKTVRGQPIIIMIFSLL